MTEANMSPLSRSVTVSSSELVSAAVVLFGSVVVIKGDGERFVTLRYNYALYVWDTKETKRSMTRNLLHWMTI